MSLPGTAVEIWQQALKELQQHVSSSNFNTWLRDTRGISFEDNVFVVGTAQPSTADWLENRFSSLVKNTLIRMTKRNLEVRFLATSAPGESTPAVAGGERIEPTSHSQACLNSRYTFDNYVIGDCNRVATAAATAIASNPGGKYNPLFIYSGVGLGKTHLLHAIGNAGLQEGLKVLCTTSEQFTNEFVDSIKNRSVTSLREKFRSPQILLVDDVHFIAGKERTIDFFCHTISELYESNHQIVVTSDRPPRALPHLGKKLNSCFEGGLVVGLQLPIYKTRLAILKAKAEERQLPFMNAALEFVAEHCQQSVRELEGALNRVAARAQVYAAPLITVELAQQALFDVQSSPERNHSISSIVSIVADHCQLTVDDVLGRKRSQSIVRARQLAMYLAHSESYHSLVQIGSFFDNRDHSTVLHSCRKIEADLQTDAALRQAVNELRSTLHGKS